MLENSLVIVPQTPVFPQIRRQFIDEWPAFVRWESEILRHFACENLRCIFQNHDYLPGRGLFATRLEHGPNQKREPDTRGAGLFGSLTFHQSWGSGHHPQMPTMSLASLLC